MSNAATLRREENDERPLSDLLMAVAAELERLRQSGWRIERAACSLALLPGASTDALRELQHLDAMLQQVAALRDFVVAISNVSGGIGGPELQAALDRITLHDVKQRLAGQTHDAESENDDGWELL